MKRDKLVKLLKRYRIDDGSDFKLKHHDPADTAGHEFDKEEAARLLAEGVARLSDLQTRLYAQDRWALLAVLQALDAGGKDGTIKHVMSGVNPQGVRVAAFKQPGPEDLAHDFLWRIHKEIPPRGHIGIFNRSHYEEVLVCRVHPALLDAQHLPEGAGARHFWKHRLEDIRNFETYLTRQGVLVRKFFLHISREEQRRRFLDRLEHRDKHWKFSASDLAERDYWDEYQDAYEAMIAATATPEAPWYVVPADVKWFAHLVVVEVLIAALESVDPQPPGLTAQQESDVADALVKLKKG